MGRSATAGRGAVGDRARTPARRYRRRHRRELAGHARMLNAGALAKPPNPIERTMMSAAVRDPEMARHFERFASRSIRVRNFLAPAAVARAARVNAPARAGVPASGAGGARGGGGS